MSIAFLGQGIASTVTGALLSDIAPKGMVGITGSSLYFVANIGAVKITARYSPHPQGVLYH